MVDIRRLRSNGYNGILGSDFGAFHNTTPRKGLGTYCRYFVLYAGTYVPNSRDL